MEKGRNGDAESQLRKEWIDSVAEFEYDLSEIGYDAIIDGEPGVVRVLFMELRGRLSALERIGVDLACTISERHKKEEGNG